MKDLTQCINHVVYRTPKVEKEDGKLYVSVEDLRVSLEKIVLDVISEYNLSSSIVGR